LQQLSSEMGVGSNEGGKKEEEEEERKKRDS
jgi:hypothetical protein